MTDFIDMVFEVSDKIENKRDLNQILLHMFSEAGELSQEVIIANGDSYKNPGKDGVVGEAVDMMLCIIDLIRIHDPSLTSDDIKDIAKKKMVKWLDTSKFKNQNK